MMRHRSRSRAGRPTSYQIVVRGELSQRYSTAFEGMALEAEDGQTTITGPVVDQAQLHGLLDRVRTSASTRQRQRRRNQSTPHH